MEITIKKTVAEIVAENVGADHVFSKYDIDFCCGGGKSLETVCKEGGVSFDVLKHEIETINNFISRDSNLNKLDLNLLLENSKTQQNYFSENIPQIVSLATKVAEVHGENHKELVEINSLFGKIDVLLSQMIETSQHNLYPFIEEFIELNNGEDKILQNQVHVFEKTVQNIEIAQKNCIEKFKSIIKLSSNYLIPEDACNSYKYLYEKMDEFEHKLYDYIHFNKNVLLPKVIKIIK